MLPKSLAVLTLGLLLTTACRSASYQIESLPDQAVTLEDSTKARAYFFRGNQPMGSLRAVQVFAGTRLVGEIQHDDYLCWEKTPDRTVFKIIFDQRPVEGEDVETFVDTTFEAGTTRYFLIDIERGTGKPKIEELEAEAARKRLASRKPASVRKG